MNPNEYTAVESEKPKGIRHKVFKRIKSVFWPIRFLWGKFKNLKKRNKKITEKSAASESGGV